MTQKCKKCLLLEAGERVTYDEVMSYVASLDSGDLTDDRTYNERIAHCRSCSNLISGMCIKCGCYVEVRARLKKSDCPDFDNRRW